MACGEAAASVRPPRSLRPLPRSVPGAAKRRVVLPTGALGTAALPTPSPDELILSWQGQETLEFAFPVSTPERLYNVLIWQGRPGPLTAYFSLSGP